MVLSRKFFGKTKPRSFPLYYNEEQFLIGKNAVALWSFSSDGNYMSTSKSSLLITCNIKRTKVVDPSNMCLFYLQIMKKQQVLGVSFNIIFYSPYYVTFSWQCYSIINAQMSQNVSLTMHYKAALQYSHNINVQLSMLPVWEKRAPSLSVSVLDNYNSTGHLQ